MSKTDSIVCPVTKNIIGQELKIDFKKNKVGTPYRVVTTKLLFGKGFDHHAEYFDMAVAKGIVKKGGAWFSWDGLKGHNKFQGKASGVELLKSDEDEYDFLKSAVIAHNADIEYELLDQKEQDTEEDGSGDE